MNMLNNFPKSQLVTVLEKKIENQSKQYDTLCMEVAKFVNTVSQELQQINTLFPEYTPHNEDYHIANLFKIADILFDEEKYYKMNIVELLLLIVSMYAHDWGMAVSKTERKAISVHDTIQTNLLDNEFDLFDAFVEKKCGKKVLKSDEDVSLEIWQDYVRETHAIRSGKRVENFFKCFNSSFAEAAGKICVGHWLEINDITDKNRYYKDSPVYGETVNLRALTIYIRLIDLFDLGEDRTPYVLWKYVNPQNEFSKMEWKKHRALHQITCPPYENGRVICISGSTDDHRVYAALMDFKKICNKYFRECSDSLAHMNDERHKLGVYFLDWRIEARNFKPISIAFDFDRASIFKVISNEIYNCHPYVFIRELIQNSIDAIAFRQKVLERKFIGGDNIGYIYVTIKKTDDTFEFVFSDDGIGMDEYILRNYFSVLGRSYYNSSDFKNKQIDMVPVSKFGVGILSCFSVSSQMEIITKREPYMDEGKTGLKIIIEDISKTFRIEECDNSKCDVGTTIKLKIKQKDLFEQLEKNKIKYSEYSVTSYIKTITSFVKYPIIIDELGQKTIIFSDDNQISKIKKRIDTLNEYELNKSIIEYPLDKVINKQDVKNFESVFEYKRFNLDDILETKDIEGEVVFGVLKDPKTNIKNFTRCWPPSEVFVCNENNEYRLRWKNEGFFNYYDVFSNQNNCVEIYNKGILLERQQFNWFDSNMFDYWGFFPKPYIKINIKNTISDISISRFDSKNSSDIIKNILKEIEKIVLNEFYSKLKYLNEYELWKTFTIYMLQYYINVNNVKLDDLMFSDVSYPFINEVGEIEYEKIIDKDIINVIPIIEEQRLVEYYNKRKVLEVENWKYGKCALSISRYSHIDTSLNSLIGNMVNKALSQHFHLYNIKFVYDEKYDFPVVQEILKKSPTNIILNQIEEILCESTYGSISSKNLKAFDEKYMLKDKFVGFFHEHKDYLFYGCQKINLNHPKARKLILYGWLLNELNSSNSADDILSGFIDKFDELPFVNDKIFDHGRKYCFSDINNFLDNLCVWLKGKFPKITDIDFINISGDDFIPGSIKLESKECFLKHPRIQ